MTNIGYRLQCLLPNITEEHRNFKCYQIMNMSNLEKQNNE